MALADVLARGRALAELRMTSRVTVRRKSGRTSQNEETGEEAPTWDVIHTDLPFRLAGSTTGDGGVHTVNVAGVVYEQATAVGDFPADTSDLQDGDYIDVTSGEWAGDTYSIVAAIKKDQATARRVPIREEARPDEWG